MTPLPQLRNRLQTALTAIGLIALATPANAETCHILGNAQFYEAMHLCVDSVLGDQAGNSYGPRNLDGIDHRAWCDGVPGQGIGQSITLRIDGGAPFRRLYLANGYGKSETSYNRNSRLRTVRLETNSGLVTTQDLLDQNELVHLYLPKAAAYRWVRLTILAVYPGSRYDDTCVDFIGPDFEEQEYE